MILEMPAFKLKKGVDENDFLLAHERFNREFMKNQKGYVSHKLIRDGDKWFDIAVWDSLESKERAFAEVNDHEATINYMSFIDQEGTDDDIPLYTVVKTY